MTRPPAARPLQHWRHGAVPAAFRAVSASRGSGRAAAVGPAHCATLSWDDLRCGLVQTAIFPPHRCCSVYRIPGVPIVFMSDLLSNLSHFHAAHLFHLHKYRPRGLTEECGERFGTFWGMQLDRGMQGAEVRKSAGLCVVCVFVIVSVCLRASLHVPQPARFC